MSNWEDDQSTPAPKYTGDLVDEAFREDGLLAQTFDGYIPREQQITLAKAIREAAETRTVLFAEAPTGVGKSLAGLIPGAEIIFKQDAPVVVVTSSIVLQEQYYHKDVPTLEKVLGRNLNAALIKGRANYLCEFKLNEYKLQKSTNTNGQRERIDIMDWAKQTKTGDVSELSFEPKREVWNDFAAIDSHDCTGKACPAYQSCHYYKARRKVLTSKLIICNYHYFLTAIYTEGMLPANIQMVIMDEGHEVSAIARDFQEQRYTMHSLRNLFNGFLKVGRALEGSQHPVGAEFTAFLHEAQLNELQGSLEQMFVRLKDHYLANKPRDKETWVMSQATRMQMRDMANDHYRALCFTTDYIKEYLNVHGLDQEERWHWNEIYEEEEIKWQRALEKLYDGLREKLHLIEKYFGFETVSAANVFFGDEDGEEAQLPEQPEDETVIHWLQEQKDNGVSMHVKPSMAAPLMGPILNPTIMPYTPVIISATLAVNGGFQHLAEDLGVTTEYRELIVTSPFDLTNNLLWYLPNNLPAGNTREHWAVAADEMIKIIMELEGRTLCLFTSNKALMDTTNYLRRMLPHYIKVVAQGEQPRQKIIAMLKEDPRMVITATRSFFTGVDVPGQNLTAVLIDKLPFPMTGDPVNDYLMSLPRGFYKFTLPETIVTLKQGYGRGNRTTADKTIVACFDGRLATAGYRPIIFNSFDFKVTATRDWEVVKNYLSSIPM